VTCYKRLTAILHNLIDGMNTPDPLEARQRIDAARQELADWQAEAKAEDDQWEAWAEVESAKYTGDVAVLARFGETRDPFAA
jgi:hypothetical protein